MNEQIKEQIRFDTEILKLLIATCIANIGGFVTLVTTNITPVKGIFAGAAIVVAFGLAHVIIGSRRAIQETIDEL